MIIVSRFDGGVDNGRSPLVLSFKNSLKNGCIVLKDIFIILSVIISDAIVIFFVPFVGITIDNNVVLVVVEVVLLGILVVSVIVTFTIVAVVMVVLIFAVV